MRMAKSRMVGRSQRSLQRCILNVLLSVFKSHESQGEDGPKIWYGPYKQLKGQQCRRGLGILGAVASLENRHSALQAQIFVSRTGHWVPDCSHCCEWFWLESGHQTRSFLGFPLIRHFFLCSLCQKWGTTPGSCSRKKQRTQWKVDFSCFCSHVAFLYTGS